MSDSLSLPFTYEPDPVCMINGCGLMGQNMARVMLTGLKPKKLLLVDAMTDIQVGQSRIPLTEFAASLSSSYGTEVVPITLDVTDEAATRAMFETHRNIAYLQHTAGVSPKPLTPPEQMTKHDVVNTFTVNHWGAVNVISQGINVGAFAPRARGVLILSTSGTVGSEGRASSAYEASKGALLNFLTLQARYFVEKYGLILNGIAPSPLRGPMAAQNPISAGRLQAVEDAMPMGALTNPDHIAAATMFFFSNLCWCAGELLTVDGGYTKHRPIYGPLES